MSAAEQTRIPAWQQAECDADIVREYERAHRLQARRERRFWPPIAGLIFTGGFALVGLIENGYIHV